jgi:hypothetical protein
MPFMNLILDIASRHSASFVSTTRTTFQIFRFER